ncbi:MAG: hypothetical protein HW406_46 [Candidatus Brocadiaceae bacterium]|nr:hypothetical protein [Candidatus Brocadiaceae bacterium]
MGVKKIYRRRILYACIIKYVKWKNYTNSFGKAAELAEMSKLDFIKGGIHLTGLSKL